MKAVVPGERFAVGGLWMTYDEAAAIKAELRARGTKRADRLADDIAMPSRDWKSGGWGSSEEGDAQ